MSSVAWVGMVAGLAAFVLGIARFACEHSDAPLSVRSHRRAHLASRLDIIRLLGCLGLGFPPRRQQGGGLLDRAGPVLELSLVFGMKTEYQVNKRR